MRIPVIQAVLGLLVVLAACYITGWMLLGVPPLLEVWLPGDAAPMTPLNPGLFTAARWLSVVLLVLGLAALNTGIYQASFRERPLKLPALVQLFAGILIVIVAVIVIAWGYPTSFGVPPDAGRGIMEASIEITPGLPMSLAMGLTILTGALGLAVTGCGMKQLAEARRK